MMVGDLIILRVLHRKRAVDKASDDLLKYAGLPRKEYEAWRIRRDWRDDGEWYRALAQKRYNDRDLWEAPWQDDKLTLTRLQSALTAMEAGKSGKEWRAKWNATYVHTPAPWSTAFEVSDG